MSLQNIIETAFENRADITPTTVTPEVKEAVLETIRQLDSGKLRVAERLGVGEWKVNEWAKKSRPVVLPHPRQRSPQRRREQILRQSADQVCRLV
ncbi:2,3,4,5-tetrahydropyridine-2,6-dicarboxylate N-succinyltransferase [Neisseria macacae ATCC 33926]|uniref:2,3,4,5-tetrahydropyridine-2,6-dicarboxylate N-succinyltransferase n=1 Tax=Neisseria macacae ATCC 33926 TaxID=997348 RepID=A0AA36XLI2_9NEIS|nr:2,3,4,5-tetrahydropyridine-2,6-dicarboxylate N-succinyltransferase [Neisseria macacae ATCC 33926]